MAQKAKLLLSDHRVGEKLIVNSYLIMLEIIEIVLISLTFYVCLRIFAVNF